jgi:hypothetical protein
MNLSLKIKYFNVITLENLSFRNKTIKKQCNTVIARSEATWQSKRSEDKILPFVQQIPRLPRRFAPRNDLIL